MKEWIIIIRTKTIETERLLLRPFKEEDFDDFYEYLNNEQVRQNIGGYPPNTKEGIEVVFQNNLNAPFTWAIVLKENDKVIGDIHFGNITLGYLANIGFVINEQYRHQGYCSEAIKAVIEHGFKILSFARIRARVLFTNKYSELSLLKNGFKKEALIYDDNFNGKIANLYYYSISMFDIDF